MVLLEYDPSVVTFEELLEVFWKSHDPTQVRERRHHAQVDGRLLFLLAPALRWFDMGLRMLRIIGKIRRTEVVCECITASVLEVLGPFLF